MVADEQGWHDPSHMRLLLSVAEQLKVPLTIMARHAELAEVSDGHQMVDPKLIQTQSQAALLLVDNYLLGLQLLTQERLLLEPVSVSSTLVDAVHIIEAYAKQYAVSVELKVAGRYGPVMAHHAGLRAALLSLGFALVEAASIQKKHDRTLTLAVHRTPKGIVTGWYGAPVASPDDWRRAIRLKGAAQQPLSAISSSSAAGMFVADALGRAMDTTLRISQHGRQGGFAMTLQPSQQLQFV